MGGGLANTCLAAQGFNIGKSLIEESMLEEAYEISMDEKIVIPDSVIVSESPDSKGGLYPQTLFQITKLFLTFLVISLTA